MAQRASSSPSAPPGEREQRALDEQQPHQPVAAGPERGAHRQLLLPRDAAREQQARDVGARDQQDEHYRRQHRGEPGPGGRLDEEVVQPQQVHTPAPVGGWVPRRQPASERVELGLRGGRGDPLAQQANGPKRTPLPMLVAWRRIREPEVVMLGEAEARRHDADHPHAATVDGNRPSDDASVSGEAATPERVADQRHRFGTGLGPLTGSEGASPARHHA